MKRLLILCIALLSFSSLFSQKQFKAFVVTTTRGWHHESIHAGFVALKELAARNNFDLDLMESPTSFTDDRLKNYQLVIFLNTTGDIFDSAQQKVMEHFVQSGKGYVGIHSASDTEYDWEWYTKLVGRMFVTHPAVQTAKLVVFDKSFPGLQGFVDGQLFTDEWYQFTNEKTSGLKYILGIDESSYSPKGDGMGANHPLAWYHEFDGGRAFYTALGHVPTNFSNQAFLDHLLAGIRWAATGKK